MKLFKNIIASLSSGILLGILLTTMSVQAATVKPKEINVPPQFTLSETTLAGLTSTGTNSTTADNEVDLICELESTHNHSYTNTTGPTDDIIYTARILKFRIYLHDDFMSNVKINSLECSSGGSWIPCDGGSSNSDGGTDTTLVQNDNSASAVHPNYVEWEYGIDSAVDSPQIPGFNDYDRDGDIDNSPAADRTMGEYLTFDFKDSISSGSATTTSSVYIKFWAQDQDTEVWTAIEEDGETDYHWNNHTVVNRSNYSCNDGDSCAALTLDPAQGDLSVDDLYGSIDLEVHAYDTNGTEITDDVQFHYTSEDYNGDDAARFRYGIGYTRRGFDVTTGDNTVRFDEAEPADTIRVEVVGAENTCNAELTFPYCALLQASNPSTDTTSNDTYSTTVDITRVEANTGEDWPYDLTYDSTAGDGDFEGNGKPYTTSDRSVGYTATDPGTISVQAENDVLNICSANFLYDFETDDDDDDDDDENPPEEPEEPEEPEDDIGRLDKYIFTFNFQYEKNPYSDEGIFFSHDEDYVYYTLEYSPIPGENKVSFTDTMWTSGLPGYLGNRELSGGEVRLATLSEINQFYDASDRSFRSIPRLGLTNDNEIGSENLGDAVRNENLLWVPYLKNTQINPTQATSADYRRINECEYDEDDNETSGDVCFDPKTAPQAGTVVIENAHDVPDGWVIRIRYVGYVDSELECDDTEDECLTEQFENTAFALSEGGSEVQADATLVVLCSYLVTRNAGDVFLEVQLERGSDISCIFYDTEELGPDGLPPIRNVDALVVLGPEGSGFVSETEFFQNVFSPLTISACDNVEFENNVVGNLSSYVCEIVTEVNERWQSSSIEELQESRVELSQRNVETNRQGRNTFNSWGEMKDALSNINNPDSGILYFKGSEGDDVLTLGSMTIPSGAWTLIVEDATLEFAGNILYETTAVSGDLPSMAFVVNGGNIHIKNTARKLSGVFFTDQRFTGDDRHAVFEDLIFFGSIYGNVQDLLDAADYVGPPTLDGGGVVVRYDSRILLNTPPGLAEYVDVSTEKAVN